jgi:type II secretory pathway pseudopilin PulG
MINKNHKTTGFTLIELLLYVGIVSVILLSISVFLSILLQSNIKNQTVNEVEQQGSQVMQIITQAVRNADIINSPATGASAPSLSINTITAGNNPTVFDISSGTFRIKEGAAATISLTNSRIIVSGLSFSNLSRTSTPGTIRIQFTLTHINPEGRNEYSFNKTFVTSATLRQP